jgi:predicted ABC-type ATPase
MPVLHLIAGPRGAGRFTLYRTLIAPRYPALPFGNTEETRDALLAQGKDFATKMRFSQASELELLAQARAHGFAIVLYVVCVDAPWLLLDRMRHRTAEVDKDPAVHRSVTHCQRTLALLREGIEFADLSLLFDGSNVELGGPELVASVAGGRMHLHTALRPRWVDKVLGFAER